MDDERACRSTLLLLDERNSDGGVRRAWQAVLFAAKRAAPGWGGTGAGCMLNVLGLDRGLSPSSRVTVMAARSWCWLYRHP